MPCAVPTMTDQLSLGWVADVFNVVEELADYCDDRIVEGICDDATILYMEDPEELPS